MWSEENHMEKTYNRGKQQDLHIKTFQISQTGLHHTCTDNTSIFAVITIIDSKFTLDAVFEANF